MNQTLEKAVDVARNLSEEREFSEKIHNIEGMKLSDRVRILLNEADKRHITGDEKRQQILKLFKSTV